MLGSAGWKGGTLDAGIRKVWPQSVLWRHGQSRSLGLRFAAAQDWSKYSSLGMWLHSEKATGSRFVILFPSENRKTEGADYYSCQITLDWIGWKRFVLPFGELSGPRAARLEPYRRYSVQCIGIREYSGPKCGGAGGRCRTAHGQHRSADERCRSVRKPRSRPVAVVRCEAGGQVGRSCSGQSGASPPTCATGPRPVGPSTGTNRRFAMATGSPIPASWLPPRRSCSTSLTTRKDR